MCRRDPAGTFSASSTAAGLHAQLAVHEPAHDVERARLSVTRSVEVDDMDQRSGRDFEAFHDFVDRAVDGHRAEIAAREAHDAAAENVERGEDEVERRPSSAVARGRATLHGIRRHRIFSTKLRSTFKPAVEDFSGWNCTPKTLPLCTAAVNGVPYVAVATSASTPPAAYELTK